MYVYPGAKCKGAPLSEKHTFTLIDARKSAAQLSLQQCFGVEQRTRSQSLEHCKTRIEFALKKRQTPPVVYVSPVVHCRSACETGVPEKNQRETLR